MNIFIGTNENCGILNGISEGFKQLGHNVTSFVKQRDRFFTEFKYDFDLSSISAAPKYFKSIPGLRALEYKLRKYFLQSRIKKTFNSQLLGFDLYVFTWGTVFPDLHDLYLLRRLNKKIAFVFIGSEARYFLSFGQQFPDIHIPWPHSFLEEDLNNKLKFIRTIELLSDSIHALPDLAGLFVRPYHPTYVPYIINGAAIARENDIPVIVHAPSSRDLKGTKLILSVLERLKNEGVSFHFRLLEGLPNPVVLQELRKADIAIDQIYLHYPGIFATEAMAMGCAVVTRTFTDPVNSFFKPPVHNVSEHNFYEKLKQLIEDKQYRVSIARAGAEYVKKINDPAFVAQRILDGLEESNKPAFEPTFFIDHFQKPPGFEISSEVKQLTKDVLVRHLPKNKSDRYLQQLQQKGLA
jgi:hypothetical protein